MAVVAGMILEGTVGPRMPTRVTSRQGASTTTTTGPTVGTGAVGALREWGTRSSRPWVSTVMGKGVAWQGCMSFHVEYVWVWVVGLQGECVCSVSVYQVRGGGVQVQQAVQQACLG